MSDHIILTPASELAAKNKAHFPNESSAYRQARNALLAEELTPSFAVNSRRTLVAMASVSIL